MLYIPAQYHILWRPCDVSQQLTFKTSWKGTVSFTSKRTPWLPRMLFWKYVLTTADCNSTRLASYIQGVAFIDRVTGCNLCWRKWCTMAWAILDRVWHGYDIRCRTTTYWGRKNMTTILYTTFSNAFSSMKNWYFGQNFTEVCVWTSNWQQVIIDSGTCNCLGRTMEA